MNRSRSDETLPPRVDRVILVGLGGVGSILAEPLARLLAWHSRGTRSLMLVDGDRYDAGNQARQMFPAGAGGERKARVQAIRLADALGVSCEAGGIEAWPEYASAADVVRLAGAAKRPLILCAVDNAASHKACLDASDEIMRHAERCYVVRPGNGAGERWGLVTVSCHARARYGDLTADPRRTHEEVGQPSDYVPGTLPGCAAQAPSEPQRLASNMMAAAWALAYVSAILDGRAFPDETLCEMGDGRENVKSTWRAGPAGPFVPAERSDDA